MSTTRKRPPKTGFMVRLPNSYRQTLLDLLKTTRRSFTAEVQVALDAHFKAHGIKPPPADRE